MKIRLKINSIIKGRFYKEGDVVEITDKDTINYISYLKRSDNIDFEIVKPLGSKSYDIFGKSLNYQFDDNDKRDFILRSYVPVRENLPNIIDYTSEMSPVKNQGQKGCHDEQTEVLTKTGWKFWKDVTEDDLLGTVNPQTHQIEFQKPIRLIKYHYDGDMYTINYRSLDFMVTPDHRMYIRKWNSKKGRLNDVFEFVPIEDIEGSSTTLKNSDLISENFFMLVAVENDPNGSEINQSAHVYIRKDNNLSINRREIKKIKYSGMVYCAEVPNHILITRRNNKILISGNSCVGFAVVAVKEWQERKEYLREIKEGSYYRRENDQYDLSEQWVYHKAKEIDPWPNEEGTSIRYALKILQKQGVPPEEGWVYDDKKIGKQKPWAKLVARWNFGGKYYRITSIPELKYALYNKGPVIIGIVCFEEIFNPGPSGIVPYPKNPWMYYGGHAVAVVGYDDRRKLFKFKNSWSPKWGQNGYGYLPYRYIEDFMIDAWVIEDISVKFEYVKTGINPVDEPTQTVLVEQENSNEISETPIWKKLKEKIIGK